MRVMEKREMAYDIRIITMLQNGRVRFYFKNGSEVDGILGYHALICMVASSYFIQDRIN